MTPGTLDVANRLLWQAGRARETQRARAREGERMAEGEGRTDGRRAGWKKGGRAGDVYFFFICIRVCENLHVCVCLCLSVSMSVSVYVYVVISHRNMRERGGEKERGRER